MAAAQTNLSDSSDESEENYTPPLETVLSGRWLKVHKFISNAWQLYRYDMLLKYAVAYTFIYLPVNAYMLALTPNLNQYRENMELAFIPMLHFESVIKYHIANNISNKNFKQAGEFFYTSCLGVPIFYLAIGLVLNPIFIAINQDVYPSELIKSFTENALAVIISYPALVLPAFEEKTLYRLIVLFALFGAYQVLVVPDNLTTNFVNTIVLYTLLYIYTKLSTNYHKFWQYNFNLSSLLKNMKKTLIGPTMVQIIKSFSPFFVLNLFRLIAFLIQESVVNKFNPKFKSAYINTVGKEYSYTFSIYVFIATLGGIAEPLPLILSFVLQKLKNKNPKYAKYFPTLAITLSTLLYLPFIAYCALKQCGGIDNATGFSFTPSQFFGFNAWIGTLNRILIGSLAGIGDFIFPPIIETISVIMNLIAFTTFKHQNNADEFINRIRYVRAGTNLLSIAALTYRWTNQSVAWARQLRGIERRTRRHETPQRRPRRQITNSETMTAPLLSSTQVPAQELHA